MKRKKEWGLVTFFRGIIPYYKLSECSCLFIHSFIYSCIHAFILFVGYVVPGLDIGIQTMCINESACFLIRPEYFLGAIGCPPRIPPDSTGKLNALCLFLILGHRISLPNLPHYLSLSPLTVTVIVTLLSYSFALTVTFTLFFVSV